MVVSRLSVVVLGVIAIACGILFEKMNIAFLMGLTFGIAASANFPVLILSMYWKDLTTRGAIFGGFVGIISAITFVVLSPTVWVGVLGHEKQYSHLIIQHYFQCPSLFSEYCCVFD